MASYKADIIQALENLGGSAHLNQIHKEVARLRKGNLNKSWTYSIQENLQRHSSDSVYGRGKYGSGDDIFYMVEGKGKGIWGLRKKFAVAPTDLDWFQQLRTEGVKGEVINFWTPTPWNINQLPVNAKLYFMLKSPIRKIGGYGKFVEYKNMKASEAWKEYGRDNGVENLSQLVSRTDLYKSRHSVKKLRLSDPEIGCILLKDPEFYENDDFKTDKTFGIDFPKQIVKLKYFRTKEKTTRIEKEREILVKKSFVINHEIADIL